MMNHADAIHRAWGVLWFGVGVLFLVVLQVLFGKVPRAYHWLQWIKKEEETGVFWFNVLVWLGLGLFCLGLAAARLIPFSNKGPADALS